MWTREPTIYKIGCLIENILTGQQIVAEEAVPLLFAADRADHTRRIILPAMDKGCIVICDRYLHSSLAYQSSGMAQAFERDWIQDINKYAIPPDLIVYLDISPEEGLSRIGKWQRIHDDKFFEDIETQKRIRQTYREILNIEKPSNSLHQISLFSTNGSKATKESAVKETSILEIDASKDQDTIQSIINEKVHAFIKLKGLEKNEQVTHQQNTLI